jgi:hypothetical protein
MVSTIKLWKEATAGTVPSPIPVAYAFKAEGFNVKAVQQTEQNSLLGNGRGAVANTYGVDDISGDIPMIFGVDNAMVMLHHGIGEATVTADATASVWVLSTVTAVGDMVNHSDGLHTLVCYSVAGTGTTGATEPDLSAYTTKEAGRGIQIIDNAGANQVVWIIMPKLYKHTGERADCLDSFGAEVTDSNACEGGTDAFSRYNGLYVNSISFSLNGDTKAVKTSLDCIGMNKEDSLLDDNFTALTITSDEVFVDDFYSFDGCTLEFNGVTAQQFTSFDVTVANNIDMQNGFNGDKIDDVGVVAVTGTLSAIFDSTLYANASDHTLQNARLILTKANGGSMTIILPQFEMEKTDKMFEVGKKTKLDISFTAFDDANNKSITYECVSPIASY